MAEPGRLTVELHGVVAGYRSRGGERRVLDGADLAIERGEMVALLGRNGSGKTTLLRVAAGIVTPTEGHVRIFGRPASGWSRGAIARRVAVLPQSAALPDGFRVGEVVALGRIPHARRLFRSEERDHEAIATALREVDADELVDRPVGELSGGERQRVLVAMALAQEPELLLLDEPTVHLDLAHQLGLLRVLDRLRRAGGITILAVLHDLNLAAAFADRAVLLDRGRVVSAGTAEQPIDPEIVRRTYGVLVEEAVTARGRRVLAPLIGGTIVDHED